MNSSFGTECHNRYREKTNIVEKYFCGNVFSLYLGYFSVPHGNYFHTQRENHSTCWLGNKHRRMKKERGGGFNKSRREKYRKLLKEIAKGRQESMTETKT